MATSQGSLIIKGGDSRFSNIFWPFLYKKRMGTNVVFFAKLGSKIRGRMEGGGGRGGWGGGGGQIDPPSYFKENSISV